MKTLLLSMPLLALLLFAAGIPALADDEPTTIELEFEDAPVPTVVQAIAKAGGINVIVSPEVVGKRITLKMTAVDAPTALQFVAETAGLQLHREPHGIYRLTVAAPRSDEPFVAGSGLEARKKLDAQVAAAKARIKMLEAEIAAAGKAGASVAETKARLSDLEDDVTLLRKRADELRVLRGRVLDAEGRAKAGARGGVAAPDDSKQVLLYDVRDLDLAKGGVLPIMKRLQGEGAAIKFDEDEGMLIVNATGNHQMRMRVALANARKKQGKVVKLERETVTKEVPMKVEVVTDGEGRFVVKPAFDKAKIKLRIERLMQAAKLLDEVGSQAEADQVRAKAHQALAELRAAEALERQAAARRHPPVRSGGATHDVGAGIQALRKDVAALRGEVRELTGLVRKLLEQNRR